MHPFFVIVERRGIRENRIAALMGVSPALFSLVKSGDRGVTPRFRRLAVHALDLLEQRHPDGRAFTDGDLFVGAAFPARTEIALGVA